MGWRCHMAMCLVPISSSPSCRSRSPCLLLSLPLPVSSYHSCRFCFSSSYHSSCSTTTAARKGCSVWICPAGVGRAGCTGVRWDDVESVWGAVVFWAERANVVGCGVSRLGGLLWGSWWIVLAFLFVGMAAKATITTAREEKPRKAATVVAAAAVTTAATRIVGLRGWCSDKAGHPTYLSGALSQFRPFCFPSLKTPSCISFHVTL